MLHRYEQREVQQYPLRWVACLLAVAGLCVSLFLLIEYHIAVTNPQHVSLCDLSQTVSCSTVARSGYAVLGGLPVAWYGVVAFFATAFMIVATWWVELRAVLLLFGMSGLLGSLVLFIISRALIGVLCPLCGVVYLVWISLAVLFFWWIRRGEIASPVSSGVQAILRFPAILVQSLRGGTGPTIALLGTLLTGVVGLATGSLPVMVDFSERRLEPLESFLNQSVREWRSAPQQTIPEITTGESPDFVRGPADAPIQIVEFADFECGACQAIYPKIESLLASHGNLIRYSLRNFPLDQSCNKNLPRPMHRNACQLAIAARCGGMQGKFWKAAEQMYGLGFQLAMNPGGSDLSQLIRQAGTSLGLDGDMFTRCLESPSQVKAIERDIDLASSLGLTGTPSFWINGKRVPRPTIEIIGAIVQFQAKNFESLS